MAAIVVCAIPDLPPPLPCFIGQYRNIRRRREERRGHLVRGLAGLASCSRTSVAGLCGVE